MNTRSAFFSTALAALSLVTPAFAAPPSAPTPQTDTPAVVVVREFLADRAAGRYDAAYALLSADVRQTNSLRSFEQGDPTAARDFRDWPAPAFGLLALFLDTHNTLNYTFTVAGTDPIDPNSVLVLAIPPAAGAAVTTLHLAVVTDPTTHALRLDMVTSIQHTDAPLFARVAQNAKRAASQSNLKQIGLGIIQYEQDHDEIAPDAVRWVDEIMRYVKDKTVFRDPSAPAGQSYNYAYNRALSHQSLAAMEAPAQLVMAFESTAGVKNAADTGQSLPHPGRYNGGTDYLFADGHVKWVPDGTKLSYRLDGK